MNISKKLKSILSAGDPNNRNRRNWSKFKSISVGCLNSNLVRGVHRCSPVCNHVHQGWLMQRQVLSFTHRWFLVLVFVVGNVSPRSLTRNLQDFQRLKWPGSILHYWSANPFFYSQVPQPAWDSWLPQTPGLRSGVILPLLCLPPNCWTAFSSQLDPPHSVQSLWCGFLQLKLKFVLFVAYMNVWAV